MRIPVLIVLAAATLLCSQVFGEESMEAKKINFAVINLKAGSGVTEGECELITDRLRTELFNTGKVNVMERSQMQEILKEQGFQQSGVCTDDACLVQMGQMLGVQTLVIGSLGKLGSMFMINARAIDVQTAKVVKVVSVDIKGDIEELVSHIPDIANQLVSSEKAIAQAPVPEKESVAEEPAAEEVQKVEPEKNPEVEPEVTEVKSVSMKNTEKNKNRSGLGITLDFFGPVTHLADGKETDNIYLAITDYFDGVMYDTAYEYIDPEEIPVMRYMLSFKIKAGPFLNVFVGPGFMFAKESYGINSNYYYSFMGGDEFTVEYSVPSINTGLGFVKRWFPLKVNAGINLNFAMPITHYSYTTASMDEEETDIDFVFSFGFRGGAEIMAGKHVGFSFDFLLNWLRWDTQFDFDELDLLGNEENPVEQSIVFPVIGFGFGVNFYY
ncbi:MAG: DUF2380 domain-containing protein [Fibrobacter sp.]|nr:DUF2380 domain-containing protein [Fibrobacter sp.]